MLTNEEIAAFLEAGYEIRAVEFKGPGSITDGAFVATVARAALALANQRDGGWIIIGVDEASSARSGLTAEQLAQWSDYDTVVDKLNRFADPPLRIDRATRSLPDGEDVVVLQIAEFDEVPVLAARDFERIIQRGKLYTRSFRKPESSAVHTQNELRAVLDLATQKQLARFLQLARDSGLDLAPGPADEVRYDDEVGAFLSSVDLQDITNAAHFHFDIRPAVFEAERVEYPLVTSKVRSSVARMRGWPYPYVGSPLNGPNWVSEENHAMHREAWVAFESGQFASWHRLPVDLHDDWNSLGDIDRGDRLFPVWMPILEFTEVLTFALRYQQAIAPEVPYEVRLQLRGAKGWKLVAGDRNRSGFHGEYAFAADEWNGTVALPAGNATTDARGLAVSPSIHLLQRFGWAGVNEQIIRSVQESFFGQSGPAESIVVFSAASQDRPASA